MKDNANVMILGQRVKLVPYLPEHVPVYNEWMKDPYLQEMTASEPLSLEEEYEMQKRWVNDDKKCTFIILDNLVDTERNRMVGDVNIFINDCEDDKMAELDIMIAEAEYRSRGFGKESLLLMINYAVNHLHLQRFRAKILMENKPSIVLFDKLNFKEVSRSEAFGEIVYEIDQDQAKKLAGLTTYAIYLPFRESE